MADYTLYVAAVYGLALVVYGGLTVGWQRSCRRVEALMAEETSR